MLLLVRTSRAGLSTNGFAAASACHRHAVSSAGGYRERRRLSCLSVALNTSTASKQQVAESVRTALRAGLYKNGSVSESPSAAVILASGTLASWLQDETFLAQILEPLADSATTSIGNSTELSVLTAAVDAIPRQRGPGNSLSSSEGLAILHGSLDKLLPGLWEGQATSAVGAFADRDSAQPALEFRAAPLEGDARPLRVIVPLANTIFTNGRPHTMFVSRWSATFEKEPRLLLEGSIEKTSQLINVHGPTRSAVDVPLVPITEARRIVAGLGNILRQVEIGVSPAPASKELELIIPKLLDARAKKLGDQATGPVSVWALLYPEHFASKRKLPKALDLSGAGESHEWVRAQEVSKSIPELLAAGCHIRKICKSSILS
ncbi:hypothetical protein B0H63DRAFT_461743 [Podospora didyma]|uniref:Uncharacterized protein n=1 Tax=Podospora didyma TaxID=330526 RepID=A0AAE0P804_9PEZI|nr:hypothetical protein B0H63DRAFT_461743 [Podospora didyma]